MTAENLYDNEQLYKNRIEGGLLRIRITNRCNGKCKFCGQHQWDDEVNKLDMPSEWYYEYCKPLYEKVNILLITGGDALVASESYPYMKFISENYPKITIMTESNGINFNQEFRELMSENLFTACFSVNGSNRDIFQKGCWDGPGGDTAYQKIIDNLWAYHELLKDKNLECFAPSISMVINKDNADDIEDFVKFALKLRARQMVFFFDYMENGRSVNFGKPETSRPALKKLMELERVLAGKIFLFFRLWLPENEVAPIQEQIDNMTLEFLQNQYQDVLELAKDRSMVQEHKLRNHIRRERGKRELSFEQDFNPILRRIEIGGKQVCCCPWSFIDLYPTGRLDFCGWVRESLNIKNFIKDGKVQWNEILESKEYREERKHFLENNYSCCQKGCPLICSTDNKNPLYTFGYEKIEK